MTSELVASPAPSQALATVLGVSPKDLLAYALDIASTLSSVLRDRGMTQKFGAGEHVKTEGWQLAGSLMGFTTDEGPTMELADGSFEATVMLRSMTTGRVVATASGRCGVDESTWRSKPKYARRSMAVTRAIGRAYAQNFRWLIKLAGYEGTPAEEMTDLNIQERAAAPRRVAKPKPQAPEIVYFDNNVFEHQKQLVAFAEELEIYEESDWVRIGAFIAKSEFPLPMTDLKAAVKEAWGELNR